MNITFTIEVTAKMILKAQFKKLTAEFTLVKEKIRQTKLLLWNI